jgi:hypothetical protein
MERYTFETSFRALQQNLLARTVGAFADNTLGECQSSRQVITIDVTKHKTDHRLRATVLHEMAHAAADRYGSNGHDLKFFTQLEKLLRLKAPVAVDTGDAGGVRLLANLVPSRFPLLKRKMDRLEARRNEAIEKRIAATGATVEQLTDDQIVHYFERGEAEALPWKKAALALGPQLGLTDEVGRALTSWARRILARAYRVHARARRDYLEYGKRKAALGLQ